MAAARYWRIVGLDTHAGGDLELSELHLYGVEGRVDALGLFTSTMAPMVGSLADLQDDDLDTSCRFAGSVVRSSGFSFVWDLGVGASVDVLGVRIGAAGTPDTFLSECTLQSSSDGVFWTSVSSFNRYAFPGVFQYTNPPSPPGDPYYDNVGLLLHMEGVNGGTAFIDNSPRPKTVSRTGTAQISTTQAKFGASSARFNGDGALIVAHSADLNLASGDFSIEFWFWPLGPGACYLIDKDGTSGAAYPSYGVTFDAGKFTLHLGNGNNTSSLQSFSTVTTAASNAWHHVEFTREGSTIFGFLNGVRQFSAAQTGAMVDGGKSLNIGARYNGTNFPANGFIDDLRITKGVARHTESFQPPDTAFPDGTTYPGGTVFLAPVLRTTEPEREVTAASSLVPPHTAGHPLVPQTVCDVECGGQGSIYGTVELYAQAGNIPLPRRVRLHRSRDGLLVRETWSNAQGEYRFDGITDRYTYDVIAWDHEGLQRSVVANDLTPEVMP